MRELAIERRLVRLVREAGGRCPKGEVEAGFPDRIALLPGGRVAFLELKRPEGRLSALQEAWHEDLERLGMEYWCLWSHKEVDEFVATLSDETIPDPCS